MRRADIGWTYFNEDRSVQKLQELVAKLLGKEAAVLVPTAGAANLAALMTLAERGTQAVLEASSHIVTSEGWSIAYVANLFPATFEAAIGSSYPERIHALIDRHRRLGLPRTSIVCLENTHTRWGGTVLTPECTRTICDMSHRNGASVHLDGARLLNAAAALGLPAAAFTEDVDSVVLSLNKGLGAPYGALLAGSRQVVAQVRENLQRIGAASVHKAGILAAAGIVAIENMGDQIAKDNAQAASLGRQLARIPGLHLDTNPVETNIVLIDVSDLGCKADRFVADLRTRGVLVLERTETQVRLVTHRMVGDAEIARAVVAVGEVVESVHLGSHVATS